MTEESTDGIVDLYRQLESKIVLGQSLIDTLGSRSHVRGVDKLKKKIGQEVVFLKKIYQTKTAKEENVNCTNVNHFEAVVSCLLACTDVIAILEGYYFQKTNRPDSEVKKIEIDIICEGGKKWIKVIARNPQALTQLSNGNGTFGKRNVFDQAKEYLQIAKEHPYKFQTPVVQFHFAAGVESILAKQLTRMGILITGTIINQNNNPGIYPDFTSSSDSECPTEDEEVYVQKLCDNTETLSNSSCEILNLDVTTMLAYVSALTNVGCEHTMDYTYPNPVLRYQAECEQVEPVKPILDELFKGKKLICCQSAAESFQSIVNTVGGPGEQVRAKDFMRNIEIVPDDPVLPEHCALRIGGQIHLRSLTVFSTGFNLKAVTVSANSGLVRAAKCQGVDFVVFIHPARALTEKKMVLRQQNESSHAESDEASASH